MLNFTIHLWSLRVLRSIAARLMVSCIMHHHCALILLTGTIPFPSCECIFACCPGHAAVWHGNCLHPEPMAA